MPQVITNKVGKNTGNPGKFTTQVTMLNCTLNIQSFPKTVQKIFPKEYLAKNVIGQFAKNEKKNTNNQQIHEYTFDSLKAL